MKGINFHIEKNIARTYRDAKCAPVRLSGQSHLYQGRMSVCVLSCLHACMYSSSDVKEGLAEFFIHLRHRAAISKPQRACKQEKRTTLV